MKIVIAGPKEAGKSIIANFLASQTESLLVTDYVPTEGVRFVTVFSFSSFFKLPFPSSILETDQIATRGRSTTIELWDASGDSAFEDCWPALLDECNGLILVYNPENPAHEDELTLWF